MISCRCSSATTVPHGINDYVCRYQDRQMLMLILEEIVDALTENPPHPKTTCHGQMWKALHSLSTRSLLFGRLPILDCWRCPSMITRKLLLGYWVLFDWTVVPNLFYFDGDYVWSFLQRLSILGSHAFFMLPHFYDIFTISFQSAPLCIFLRAAHALTHSHLLCFPFGLYENRRIHNYSLWSSPVAPFAKGLQHLPGNRAYRQWNPISWPLEIGIVSTVHRKAPIWYFSE